MPRARPSTRIGTARVLDRRARASPDSPSPISVFISGEGSSNGWTPTPSTTPVATSATAKRRCRHVVATSPTRATRRSTKPVAIEPARHHVVTGRGRGGGVGVAHVEEPVAKASPHLRRRRGEADRLQRLRVRQHVGAATALDRQHRDPPQRHAERQAADLGAVVVARRHVIWRSVAAITSHSSGAGTIIISAVAFTAPTENTTRAASAACRQRVEVAAPDGQADDPAEPGPREEHRRRPRDVRQDVRGELVDDGRGEGGAEAETESAGRPQHATARGEHQRADPQPVGHPVGQPDRVAQPVPGSLRPEVGDDLVGDPAGELPAVERPRGVGDQPSGVEIEVQLGVGGHPAGRRGERRNVRAAARARPPRPTCRSGAGRASTGPREDARQVLEQRECAGAGRTTMR